jgi:two-component system sensor histidine kinase CiaH
MFEAARLKLTAWYLLIIMIISIVFSVAFYRAATVEVERIIRIEEMRQRYGADDFFRHRNDQMAPPSIQDLQEAEGRLRMLLVVINGGILLLAGASGYFLAGRTLRPIQTMVDEQHRFITDASHELRTPLTAMRSEIEVGLRDKTISLLEAKRLLESNLEEVGNLQVLSDSLLQLTQAKTNTRVFHQTQLAPLVETAVKKVTPIAKQKKITITNSVTDAHLEGDETSLIQLFVILLDNAIKYSPPKTEITIKSKKTDHTVVINVIDQGMGISEKDVPFIFERFYRVDKSRSRDMGGYGLGLSIAEKVVKDHKGSINVTSKPEKGTTFTIQLPAK